MNLLTTAEAAARLKISPRRVQALISAGRLAATKIGRDWIIPEYALEAVAERKPGRPKRARAGGREGRLGEPAAGVRAGV